MDGNYFVIHKRVLPEVYEKVLNAKKLIKEGKVKEVTEATKMAGISRSVYYKYKDYIYEFSESPQGRKATFNIMIIDGRGKGRKSRIYSNGINKKRRYFYI